MISVYDTERSIKFGQYLQILQEKTKGHFFMTHSVYVQRVCILIIIFRTDWSILIKIYHCVES